MDVGCAGGANWEATCGSVASDESRTLLFFSRAHPLVSRGKRRSLEIAVMCCAVDMDAGWALLSLLRGGGGWGPPMSNR